MGLKKTGSILVMTYWSYEDALIQTYTLPYVKLIRSQLSTDNKIILVTLEKNKVSGKIKEIDSTGIYHLELPYHPFGVKAIFSWIKSLFQLGKIIRKFQVATIHAWCTPAGTLGYLLAKRYKKQLVIDSYEPHAEAMVENGSWSKKSLAFKMLFYFEKKQTKSAHYLIAATQSMTEYALSKYQYTGNNFLVKPACVDFDLFNLSVKKDPDLVSQYGLNDKIIGVYAGKFGGIYFEDEVFDLIASAYHYFGDRFVFLLLSNYSNQDLERQIERINIPASAIIKLFVPHHQIPSYLGLADFAICPVKPVPSKKYCTPIKNGEYWALGLPVIISKNISDDSDLIEKENIGYVLQDMNEVEFLNAFTKIDFLLNEVPGLSNKIIQVAKTHRNFSIAKTVYSTIYSRH